MNLYFDPSRYTDGGYSRGHKQVAWVRGKPSECEGCHTTDPNKRYEWANYSGEFLNPADYIRLCCKCHQLMDGSPSDISAEARKNQTHCLRGHKYTNDNTYVHKDGRRQCGVCRRKGSLT